MRTLKQIREAFGMSQQMMADYLDVSRTLYSMYETRRRELPTPALLKIGELEIALQHPSPYKGLQLQKQSGKDEAVLRRYVQQCSLSAETARRKLEQMRNEYDRCLQALAAMEQLQNKQAQEKASQKDRLCLELQQLKLFKKLSACTPVRQLKLTLTAQAMELQAAEAKQYAADFAALPPGI